MNSEELKKEFGLLMPSEINGFKRPDESIPSSNDFFLEIPQLISKDPVLYSTMNLIFSVILSNDKLLKQWLDTLQNVVSTQDWREVTDSLKGYMTPELKKKLDGIAMGANNYVHPSSHPASMIAQDATHRFVSDTEKNTWNAKASTAVVSTTANGLAPKRDGNASHFLAGDGTWKAVPSASSATSATKATQDSRGQQIDTTYIKGVTGSNATLTVTKGNGTTSTVTVNNVANATNANVVTEKAITGNTLASALPVGMTWSKVYNNGFPCAYGNCLSIRGAGAIQIVTEWSGGDATPANMYYRNARDSSIDKWSAWRTLAHTGGTISNATTASKLGTGTVGSGVKPIYLNAGSPAASGSTVGSANKPVYLNAGTISQCSIDLSTLAPKASPALTGSPTAPTQGTSDNSTKIATTAFVRNLINQFKNDGTLGGIVGGSLTQNGWVKFSNGLILQWGNDTNSDYDISPSLSKTFNFPTTFLKNCFIVLPVLYGNWGACVVWVYSKTLTNCTVKFEEWASNIQRVHLGYIAIGN